MIISIDQTELIEEVAEFCEYEPDTKVYAMYKSTTGVEYVYDFVFAELPSEQEFLAISAPYHSEEEYLEDKKAYEELVTNHKQALDTLTGKFKSMTVSELLEILLKQRRSVNL